MATRWPGPASSHLKHLRTAGAEMLELEVLASNQKAREIYERWGFTPVELILGAPVGQLKHRLAPTQPR